MAAACLGEFRVGGESGTDGTGDTGETGGCEDEQAACGGGCVDVSTSEDHCGACGNACAVDQSCEGGQCVGECEADCDPVLETCAGTQCLCRIGFTRCGAECVDFESDPAHCGKCSSDCGGQVCEEGECSSEGCNESGNVECDGACVDPDESPLHCGGCGEPCDADQLCVHGNCRDFDPASCETDDQCSEGRKCCEAEPIDSMVCIDGDECP